jgi:hypothetical protein
MTHGWLSAFGIAGLLASGSTALGDTVTLKCSFKGIISQDIVYVVNEAAKDVAIIGDFGTHQGFVLTYNKAFFYILEPNNGASVATLLYILPDDTPVGIRTTLGIITPEQFRDIPTEMKLASDKLNFIAAISKGRCPIQK